MMKYTNYKGIYLGACRAYHENYNIDYNDITPGYHINIIEDMLKVALNKYDYIIATPPCNYYSRANYRRETSKYSLETKHLLPCIMEKLGKLNKPYIIENVRSYKRFKENGIIDIAEKYGMFIYTYGRHTYFTNIMINLNGIKQRQDMVQGGAIIKYGDEMSKYRQGGYNVHNVIEYWLSYIHENKLI